jgi:hypothetical protein
MIIGGASFALGAIVSAVIQGTITRFFDRSRPSLKVSDISIGRDPAATKKRVLIDMVTRQSIARNPVMPELEKEPTTETLMSYLENCKQVLYMHDDVVKYLADLVHKPHILDASLDRDKQRVELLREWATYGEPLGNLARDAIEVHTSEIDPLYTQGHPQEWKTGPRTSIELAPGRKIALFELDEDAYVGKVAEDEGPQERERALRYVRSHNVYRRFWIHLNEQHLRWLFTKVYHRAISVGEDARKTMAQIETLVQVTSPDYLRISVVLTNSGGRAFAVKPFAYLRLPRVDAVAGEDALIPLMMEADASAAAMPVIVKGNDAVQVVWRSETSLNGLNLTKKDGSLLLDGNRLRTLYAGQVLSSTLSLNLTGFGLDSAETLVSEPHDFGVPAYARDRGVMARALRGSK